MKSVLFICTGNYYRSKFAEIYFNFRANKVSLDWYAFSRGFDISNKENTGPISNYSIDKLTDLGIIIPEQINMPKLLTEKDLLSAGKIIVLNEEEHAPFIKKYSPFWEHKTIFWNIHDLHEENSETSLHKLIIEIENIICL